MTEGPPKRKDNPYKFSIQEALNAMETDEPYTLIKFEHEGQNFQIDVTQFSKRISSDAIGLPDNFVDTDSFDMDEYRTSMRINSAEGKLGGVINGIVIFEGDEFVSFSAINKSRDPGNVQVSHLVQESIIKLIENGVFEVWNSSYKLTQQGMKMYQNIQNSGRIHAEPSELYDGRQRWRLTSRASGHATD